MKVSQASPAARALLTLEYLQIKPGITAGELSQKLGVSDRAVRRYISILRQAELPIKSTTGPYGGYRLGRGLRQPPLVFTASEAVGLVMAVLDGHHAAADPEDPVGAALGKLIRSLPKSAGQQASTMRRHARAAPDRRAARPDPAVTSALVGAIESARGAHILYVGASGTELETDVDPWAVVVRHGRWYLLCFAHAVDDTRAFRIDRIRRLDERHFEVSPPPDLNPVEWLDRHLGRGRPYETQVVFEAELEAVAPYIRSPMGRIDATPEGCVLRGSTSNPAMYAAEWLAPIPFPFYVVGGAELVSAVEEVGRRLMGAVERSGSE